MDRIDPIGDWVNNFRLAYLSALITNLALSIHGDKKKGITYKSPMDFMINWDVDSMQVEPKKQSVEQMKEILLGIAKEQNKRVRLQPDMTTRPPVKRRNLL